MSPPAALLLLAASSAAARVVAVRAQAVEGRAVLRVLALGSVEAVDVHREGPELVLSIPGDAPAGLEAPAAVPPFEAVRILVEPQAVEVRIRVSAEVSWEIRRDGSVVSLFFGAPEEPAPPAASDVGDLYKRIFPPPTEAAGGQVTAGEAGGAKPEESADLGLGPVKLRPSLSATYVDAQSTLLATPQPVRDRYLEIQPRLGAELTLFRGHLKADYEPRIRGYSSFPQVNKTSHTANALLDLPLGARLTLDASDHYARGLLETREVDPGGEYFFRLGRFWRNEVGGTARLELGPRLGVDLGGSFNRVRFVESAGFFSYESRRFRAGLGFEATPNLRAGLAYVRERVPAPAERTAAESTGNEVQLTLTGEIFPLVSGVLSAGYLVQSFPNAASGGRAYRGLDASGTLKKEFSRATTLSLTLGRSTRLSAFEGNGFYVSNWSDAELTLPLALSVSGRAGAGYHWNQYRTLAAGLAAPRKDRVFGWAAGLGRSLTRWAFLRADYRKDRRNSNLDVFDIETHALTLQLGVGLFGSPERP